MSPEQNKARVLDLIERAMNGHDVEAFHEYTSNPAVVAGGAGLVGAFPDLRTEVRWIMAEGDMVVAFQDIRGTHQGRFLFVQEPTGRPMEASILLAFKFDDDGQIIDSWLGTNFIDMLAQLGWGFAPVGEVAQPPG